MYLNLLRRGQGQRVLFGAPLSVKMRKFIMVAAASRFHIASQVPTLSKEASQSVNRVLDYYFGLRVLAYGWSSTGTTTWSKALTV